MISTATLSDMHDEELRSVISQAVGLLKQRDEERKAKAIIDARATLAAAGLTLKDLAGKSRTRTSNGAVYHSGHQYQHPTNKSLAWNGKGKKPGWLNTLEAEGKTPVEVAS
jgi:DNA-binding protein H-NS